jgi:hypothetical protein
MTVIGQFEDGEIYIEHVHANTIPLAIGEAIIHDFARWDARVVAVLRGHVQDVDPDFALGHPEAIPGCEHVRPPDLSAVTDRQFNRSTGNSSLYG